MTKEQKLEHILIIWNPASTNSRRLKNRKAELKSIFPDLPVTYIETSAEGRAANRELILTHRELLGPKTLLCIAAGDGTVNLVIETLMSDETLTDDMRKTPILPLWGGNANDLAHMLNGYASRTKLKTVFTQGKIIPIKPLLVTIKSDEKIIKRVAACYVSFGAIAFAANRINNPTHRQHKLNHLSVFRIFLEINTVVRAFIDVPRFKILENGSVKTFYEYALINGSRMAKLERLPISLTDNAFYMARIRRKHPIVALYILQILRRRRFGRITSNRRSFTVLDPTWLQLDGEVIRVQAKTHVDIELGSQPFYAMSRRLKNPIEKIENR